MLGQLKPSIIFKLKKFAIELPAEHLLPEYQRQHAQYDKFLPILVKYLEQKSIVVDIGANVGDSLAAMVEQNIDVSYICIEADDFFFQFLEKNVLTVKHAIEGVNVEIIQALVGKSISGVYLEGKDGSKHAVKSLDGGITSQPLDEILLNVPRISLLKSDVDGFDYDVIDSSMGLIQKYKPILYFECQYADEIQRAGYLHTITQLNALGYGDWTVFDNFGAKMLRTENVEIVLQMLNYVWNQNIKNSTRTIYYLDILVVQKSESELIDKVLSEYS